MRDAKNVGHISDAKPEKSDDEIRNVASDIQSQERLKWQKFRNDL